MVSEKKDVVALRSLFSETITLRDWDQRVNGIDAVAAVNQDIFDTFSSINVEILETHESKDMVAAELKIRLINDEESLSLLVTDVIGFDQDGKIRFIRAYKG